jgi:UDP-glucose 4-epimerase
MPYVAQVAVGRREFLNVWGNDYPTPDGTGVRDYIHVVDLAAGHVKAVQFLERNAGCNAINLGAGVGHSVLDLVHAFESVSGKPVPVKVGPRRSGDLDAYWADPSLARDLLGWYAERGMEAMCLDTWKWQQSNPNGYKGAI